MANLLKGRSASHKSSYEGFDLSHNVFFTSSVGHVLPIHWDFLLPGDKVDIKTHMKSRLLPMNSASPILLREHVDYYFVPLECLYSLFPSLLSDTNEDAASTLFDKNNFQDGFPMVEINGVKNSISALSTGADFDNFGFDAMSRGASRLIEFFKYGTRIIGAQISSQKTIMSNLLLAQAYQAVWQYYFRDDKRVEFNPSTFNIDAYYNTLTIPTNVGQRMLNIYYRPWKKDPYTIVSPSPLGGQTSFNHFSSSTGTSEDRNFASFVKQWLSKDDNIGIQTTYKAGTTDNNGDYPSLTGSYTDTVFPNRVNASTVEQSLQQHRIAQAIEKLSAIWMQSGKNYKDMMNNMFGVPVRDDWSKPIYIGSDTNEITIDEEIANVTTGDGTDILTNAGDITGRGFGKSIGRSNKFTSQRHGILLALYSCIPDACYGNVAFDIFNTYSKRNSFPFPSTDELGEQPLFEFEVDASLDTLSLVQGGWLPRFHELKLKEDRAYGDFRDTLSYWIPFRDTAALNQFALWQDFYIRPNYLDNIMLVDYKTDRDTSHPFSTDPLMHFFRVEETKASKMSSFGVPNTYFG